MNFSFTKKSNVSSIFATSKVYRTGVPTICVFFHKSGAFSTKRGQVNIPILDSVGLRAEYPI